MKKDQSIVMNIWVACSNITIGKLREFDGYKADEVLNLLLEDYG